MFQKNMLYKNLVWRKKINQMSLIFDPWNKHFEDFN